MVRYFWARLSVLPSLPEPPRAAAVCRSSLTPSAGPAQSRGCSQPGTRVSDPGALPSPASPLCDSGSPVRVPGVCYWPVFFPPATTRLERWNGRLWARSGATFWDRRALLPWAACPPRAPCPRCQLCPDLPSPLQRPMLDVGFSLPFGAVTDWVFYPSVFSSMVST